MAKSRTSGISQVMSVSSAARDDQQRTQETRLKELQVTARCKIHDGKLDAFRTVAEQCLRSVRQRDEGTMQYDWFFNEDHTECVVRERYRDSDALLEHIANLGETMGALLETCDLSVEVFGDPSAELVEATTSIPTRVYSYFQGA